ncbi:MAG: hypothetical protein GZ087_07490 [Flavobacterium sp.]|nr:hypothetical protein [Flavobacterium sp.]
MKKIISDIAAFFLAALVLFSSVSFTVERHLCGGHVFSASVFGKAEKCVMEDDYCVALNNNHSLSKKSCCKEEIQLKNGSVFKSESNLKFHNKQQQNLVVFNLINYSVFFPNKCQQNNSI